MASKTRLAAMVGGFVVVFLSLRRVGRRSGATSVEVNGALPGDDVVSQPQWESTRAITINVPPAQVWPWIVQMGFPAYRAGWYTPYWLDRVQWSIRNRSSDEIRDDLQSLCVGDLVPDSLDWSVYFTVETLERARYAPRWSWLALGVPYQVGDFVNSSNILRAVKMRSEQAARRQAGRGSCTGGPRPGGGCVASRISSVVARRGSRRACSSRE